MSSLLSQATGRAENPQGGDSLGSPSRPGFRTRLTDHLSVAVGTSDGLFVVVDGETQGPYFRQFEVSAFAQVGPRCFAAATNPANDPMIYSSDDHGITWNLGESGRVAFEPRSGRVVNRVTQLVNATAEAPSDAPVVLAGAEPPALFRSRDGGRTFEEVAGFSAFAERAGWYGQSDEGSRPALHTLLADGDRIIAGVSGAGMLCSTDGGSSWAPCNDGLPADGAEVSKIAQDPRSPDVFWARSGAETYRFSEAGGWERLDPTTPEVVELDSTGDAGLAWAEVVKSVPLADTHYPVLRDAFATGSDSPFALAFGTQAGEVLASLDGGITWRSVATHLPPVLCVRVLD